MSRPVKSLQATSQQTRHELLEAGLRLMMELPASTSFGHLTANRIATTAGRTTGAFFHQWPTFDAYLGDLVAHVMRPELAVNLHRGVQTVLDEVASGRSVGAALSQAGRGVPEATAKDPQTVLQVLMWARVLHDEDFQRDISRHYDLLDRSAGAVIEHLAHLLGRRIRPPFTPAVISAAISAIAEGLAMRATLTPGFYPEEMFGWMVAPLLPLFTSEPGDDRMAEDFVDDLGIPVDADRIAGSTSSAATG